MDDKEEKQKDTEKQKDLQQRYMEMQYMQQHLTEYQKQLEMLNTQIEDCSLILEGLDDISKKKPGEDMLVPISNGIFAKAKLDDNSSLVVNVGSNIAVEKNVDGAKELIRKQQAEMVKTRIQMKEVMNSITEQMQAVEKELAEVMQGT
ncbi:MAG: prefoldin subunit alpha [Nanoarchaeota archaeon]|nr:prefoldin subunit alpha [Nanoarchaeota archaeon]